MCKSHNLLSHTEISKICLSTGDVVQVMVRAPLCFCKTPLFLEAIPLTTREEDQLLNDGYKFIRYDTKHKEVVLTKRL